MKRSEKAEQILFQLEELYPAPPIPLDHRDPFTLLIAVLLSAQCTDKRVNMVTPALFAKAMSSRPNGLTSAASTRKFRKEVVHSESPANFSTRKSRWRNSRNSFPRRRQD